MEARSEFSTKPIYLKLDQQPKDIVELLKKLFSYKVEWVSNVRNIQTFSNKECTRNQCTAGRYRSFDDVYRIVNTYFPNTSKEEIMTTLLKLDIRDGSSNAQCNLIMDFCCTIDKIVMHYRGNGKSTYSHISVLPKYRSKYRWRDLLNSIGVNSQQELDNIQSTKI